MYFVNRVLPREVAQAVMVPTTLVSRSGVRGVSKELPRIEPDLSMLFGASKPKARLETFSACIRSGDTSGKTIIPTCSPQYSPLFASRAFDTAETGLV